MEVNSENLNSADGISTLLEIDPQTSTPIKNFALNSNMTSSRSKRGKGKSKITKKVSPKGGFKLTNSIKVMSFFDLFYPHQFPIFITFSSY